MKYELSVLDYLELFYLMTPEQIQEEFTFRACSARTIRRIYSRSHLQNRSEVYKHFENDLCLFGYTKKEKRELIKGALEKLKEKKVAEIWAKIAKEESLWD